MHPEFPFKGTYSVKYQLEVAMLWRGVTVGWVYGWALANEDDGELSDVVICDAIKCDDETKWVAVSRDQSGPLELAARALWCAAQIDDVKAVLKEKFEQLQREKQIAAEEHYYESIRESRLLAAE